MASPPFLRSACLLLSALAISAGGLGMLLSFLYLASSALADIIAGVAGFVAGAVLIAGGLLALTVLAISPPRSDRKEHRDSEFA